MGDILAQTDPRNVELHQLQREYRHMELNRRAYAEESQALLRKQQTNIDKLKRDNETLKNDIAIIMRGSNRPQSTIQQEFVQGLVDAGDKYANSIEFERKNMDTMEEQIHIMRQKILQQRRAMGGVNAAKENHFMIQKQIRILENRLDKSLIKFNESISHNKSLREKIDNLRRERVVFENLYRKMERELQDRKKSMAEIIEVSNQNYEQRDTFQMEIAAIEQANRKEQEEFEEQMMTLGRVLDTELQLPTVGANIIGRAKSLSKFSRQLSTRSLPRSYNEKNEPASNEDTTGEMFRTTKSAGELNGKVDIDFKERAQNFEEAFNKIKSATGITDIDELVRTFIKNEEHNFSLFNYVNEQNNEIEKLEEQIQQLKEEEQKFAQESGNDVNQHKEILKDLENKLQASDLMAEKYERRCQDLQRITESLKRGMQSIFSKFEFTVEEGSVPPLVTDVNMVQHLGLIERKANQLLQNYSNVRHLLSGASNVSRPGTAEGKAGDLGTSAELDISQSLVTVLGAGPKVPMGQELLHVNPPKADDYRSDDSEDDDDEDTRPLTREELKSRTLSRLQRRGQSTALGGALNTPGTSGINTASGSTTGMGNADAGGNGGTSGGAKSGGKKKVGIKK